MNLDGVFKHILKNPKSYPGLHLNPNLNKLCKQELDSLSQFHLIVDEMIRNIHINLLKGKSVFVKGEKLFLFYFHFWAVYGANFGILTI